MPHTCLRIGCPFRLWWGCVQSRRDFVLRGSVSPQPDWNPGQLRDLFPPEVQIDAAWPLDYESPLFPEEERSLRNATAIRRAEFATGRACARSALARLGLPNAIVPVGSAGQPIWPTETVGSITHCNGFVGAAVGVRNRLSGIGFDCELAGDLSAPLVKRVCTPAELDWIADMVPPSSCNWPKILFTIKESIYKCLAPQLDCFIDFHDVAVTVQQPDEFSVLLVQPNIKAAFPPGVPLQGRFLTTATHVFGALVALEP